MNKEPQKQVDFKLAATGLLGAQNQKKIKEKKKHPPHL